MTITIKDDCSIAPLPIAHKGKGQRSLLQSMLHLFLIFHFVFISNLEGKKTKPSLIEQRIICVLDFKSQMSWDFGT